MELLIPCLIFAALLVWREFAHDRRVNQLLDRIQFPQQVETERAPDPSGEDHHIPLEDDEAWEKFMRDRGVGS